MQKECRGQNYGLYEGIESVLFMLRHADFAVESSDYKLQGSWQAQTRERAFAFEGVEMKKPEGLSLIAPSNFGLECSLAKLVARFSKNIPIEAEKSREAVIGSVIHEFMLNDFEKQGEKMIFQPMALLEKSGLPPMLRKAYTEKKVYYICNEYRKKIIASGRLDFSFFIVGNNKKDLVIGDVKRAMKMPYAKKAHALQLLSYGLGIMQSRNDINNIYLVLVNRARHEGSPMSLYWGDYRQQEISIIRVNPRTDMLLERLHEQMLIDHTSINRLLMEVDYAYNLKRIKQEEKKCEACFPDNREKCDYVFAHLKDCRNIADMLGLDF